MLLYDQISGIINISICSDKNTYENFHRRVKKKAFTRDENSKTHFCIYFLPHDQQDKKIFIVHHKKSGLWISPGGHIDKGEDLLGALNREIKEELGVGNFFKEDPFPFFLTITPIKNEAQTCEEHFDIWYIMNTNGADFDVDPKEFYETRWMTFDAAERIVTDPQNRKALQILRT